MKNKRLEEILSSLKKNLETLEVQLNLGSKDAKDLFEKKRDELNNNIENIRKHAKDVGREGSVHLEKLEKEGKELIELLNANFNFSYNDFDKAETKTKNMRDHLDDIYKELEQESDKFKGKAQLKYKQLLDKLQMEFSIQKKYAEKKGEDLEKWKQQLRGEINNVKQKIDKNKYVSEDKIDNFTNELKEAFEHIRKAFMSFKK